MQFRFWYLFLLLTLLLSCQHPLQLAQDTIGTVKEQNEKEKEEPIKKTKYEMKIEQSRRLEEDGSVKVLKEAVKNYYSSNKELLIDFSSIKHPGTPESILLFKIIEEAMFDLIKDIMGKKSDGAKKAAYNMDFSLFETGDIILVMKKNGFCPYGYFSHAGIYDEKSGSFISAQIADAGNGVGVIRESPEWYRTNFDQAVGLSVKCPEGDRKKIARKIISYLNEQIGKPYSLLPGYTNRDSWYCSKLPWIGWKDSGGIDLKAKNTHGLEFCLPDNIFFDDDVFIFTISR